MVTISTPATLESFRRFIISSTCKSYAPRNYLGDSEVFAERDDKLGAIYVEAADKVTLKKIRDITFMNARDVLKWKYISKMASNKKNGRQSNR